MELPDRSDVDAFEKLVATTNVSAWRGGQERGVVFHSKQRRWMTLDEWRRDPYQEKTGKTFEDLLAEGWHLGDDQTENGHDGRDHR